MTGFTLSNLTQNAVSSLSQRPPPPPTQFPPPPSVGVATPPPPGSTFGQGISGGPSYAPPATYAVMHLAKDNRLRILGFPPALIQPLDATIRGAWPKGVKEAKEYDESSYEWKLGGHPWSGQGKQAIPARRLMCHLLHCLSGHGWHLAHSVDLSRKGKDKDSLMFKAGPAVFRDVFSVSFNEKDKIRIIGAPNPQVQQAFIDVVKTWPLGIQEEKMKEPGCYQLKLRGEPWSTSDGKEVNKSRLLTARLLGTMEQLGYELVGSVAMSVGGADEVETEVVESWLYNAIGTFDWTLLDSEKSELDSWFFARKI